MRKTLRNILVYVLFIIPLVLSPAAANTLATGYTPIPIDLSHLAKNPPVEGNGRVPYLMDSTIPSKYDLRSVDGTSYLTRIKDQSTYGVCWAFASIGAMESNYKKNTGKDIDLSEMHLAWYTFKNDDKSKTFNYKSGNTLSSVLGGGNAFYPAGLYSRLDGPILETDLPYPPRGASNAESYKPASGRSDAYTPALRLKEVYYLAFDTVGSTTPSVGTSEASMNIIKRRIMENGSVVASYYSDNGKYHTASNTTTYYVKSGTSTNHAVQIVGWDDDFPASNFNTTPSRNGAWLIKNSWGTWWGDSGYFWMSYDQYLRDGTAFIVDDIDKTMKAYYYDAIGWCGYSYYNYAANVFQSERDEYLTEAGFYTTNNNVSYKIDVYVGGSSVTSMPTDSPILSSEPVSTTSGTIAYAGYHTVTLDTPVELNEGEYFSVVMYMSSAVPVEKNGMFGNNVVIEKGSFFYSSYSGWAASTTQNACIKAFTTTSLAGTPPKIKTSSLTDAMVSISYTCPIEINGSNPMTITVSGLPAGLSYNSDSKTITGTPTQNGTYSVTVTATNAQDTDSKTYTLIVNPYPRLKTSSFSGYVGYALNAALEMTDGATVKEWTLDTKALPKGLKFDKKANAITGKPSQAGTYSIDITATITSITEPITGNATFSIDAKPVSPKIGVSSLPNGELDTEYSQSLKITGTAPLTVSADGLPLGLAIKTNSSGDTIIHGTPTDTGQFNNITITVSNKATELDGKGAVTKKIKLKVTPQKPHIRVISLDDAIVGEEYEDVTFEVSSGTEITWAASGLPKGMTFDAKTATLSGTPQGNAKTYSITLKAANTGGKDQAKIPLNVLMKPELSTKKLSAGTDGKKYSAKLATKGLPTSWNVTGLPETLTFTPDTKGGGTITGTPDTMGKYEVSITMSNTAGTTNASLDLEIKGVAPKVAATMPKSSKVNESYNASITATGTKPITLTYDISDKDKSKFGISDLSDLGLSFTTIDTLGSANITGTPTKSIKGLPVTITASNAMSGTKPATKKISITITGDKPTFTVPDADTRDMTTGASVDIDFTVNGTPDITFTMNKVVGFTLTPTGTHTAKLTGTVPNKAGKTAITITAANNDGKATKKITINAKLPEVEEYASTPDENYAVPEEDTPSQEAAQEVPEVADILAGDDVVTLGAVRTIGSLPESVRDMLEAEGYTIAAVLPEVSASESGLHDLEAVLGDDVETGARLYWFAFPQNAEPSEDDEISEFYDEDGAEIETVPEGRNITVSAWLNEGVIYAPVIAVKSEE